MPPLVSVVIPTYKSGAWVAETLASVVSQTYPADRLEIIVTDDVSPDDSVAVARKFLDGHRLNSRVVVREKNGGAAANRNSGYRLASGDWIQFLDADDLLAPHKIELQARVAADAPYDVAVVYSNWQYYQLEGGKWQPVGPLNAPVVDDDPVLRMLQDLAFGYVGPTLIRRAFLERVGGFDERPNLGEDSDLMLRIAMAGGRFREARSETAAFLYRQWPESLWRSHIKNVTAMRNLMGTYRRAEAFLREQSPNGLSEAARVALAGRYSRFADLYLENDPETFRELMGWLAELGFDRPTGLTPRVRMLSRVIGYENAVRLRSAFRKQVQRFRQA